MEPLILQRPGSLNPAGWYNPRPVLTPLEDPALPPETNFTHTGLDPFTRYQYRVTARNLAGTQDRVATPRSGRQKQVRFKLHLRFHVNNSFGELVKNMVCSISLEIVKVVAINALLERVRHIRWPLVRCHEYWLTLIAAHATQSPSTELQEPKPGNGQKVTASDIILLRRIGIIVW